MQKSGDAVPPNCAVVQPDDKTITDDLAELRWELRNLILDGAQNVIIDLSRVERLPSNALATLLSTHRVCRARRKAGHDPLANRGALDLLRHTGLDHVFAVEEALD